MQDTAKMMNSLTEDELLRLRTRALRIALIVTSLELARRAGELVPERPEEFAHLLGAVTQAFKASLSAAPA